MVWSDRWGMLRPYEPGRLKPVLCTGEFIFCGSTPIDVRQSFPQTVRRQLSLFSVRQSSSLFCLFQSAKSNSMNADMFQREIEELRTFTIWLFFTLLTLSWKWKLQKNWHWVWCRLQPWRRTGPSDQIRHRWAVESNMYSEYHPCNLRNDVLL